LSDFATSTKVTVLFAIFGAPLAKSYILLTLLILARQQSRVFIDFSSQIHAESLLRHHKFCSLRTPARAGVFHFETGYCAALRVTNLFSASFCEIPPFARARRMGHPFQWLGWEIVIKSDYLPV
jgi:hypothetical protein